MLTVTVRKLTVDFVKRANAEAGKERSVYWDEDLPGFGLMVTESGHRSWVVQYRVHHASRRVTINGVLSLHEARKEAKHLLGQVAKGGDPVLDRRKAAESSKTSLKAVAERYLQREGDKLRTTTLRRSNLERLVYPKFGAWQIDDIRRSDINHLLDDIEDKSGAAMADQVLALLRRIFNWHAIRDDHFRSPIVPGMSRRKNEEHERDRVLSDDELRSVWLTAEKYPVPWGQFIRFLLLTAARRTEVAGMTWTEISGDRWTIPAARYKTNIDFELPLSRAAADLLPPKFGEKNFVFTTTGETGISGFSKFKAQFDALMLGELRDAALKRGDDPAMITLDHWTIHDLRRTARSAMTQAGVPPDACRARPRSRHWWRARRL